MDDGGAGAAGAARIKEIITDHAITTIGTNRLPLKNSNASGSFLKL